MVRLVRVVRAVRVVKQWFTSRTSGELHIISERLIERLVNHCFTTHTARTTRTSRTTCNTPQVSLMICNSPLVRLVNHCFKTRMARTTRTSRPMPFTTRIRSCILDNPPTKHPLSNIHDLIRVVNGIGRHSTPLSPSMSNIHDLIGKYTSRKWQQSTRYGNRK